MEYCYVDILRYVCKLLKKCNEFKEKKVEKQNEIS